MNPAKVDRARVRRLLDLPNVGPQMTADLELLGFHSPSQLVGADPLTLYRSLCTAKRGRQDLCVLDVLISVTRFVDGDPPAPWWHYTAMRKRTYGDVIAER